MHRSVSKKIELIWRFQCRLSGFATESDDALILFVGKLKNVHLTAGRQYEFDSFGVRIQLSLARTKAQIDAELTHLKAHVQQGLAKVRGRLALGFFEHG